MEVKVNAEQSRQLSSLTRLWLSSPQSPPKPKDVEHSYIPEGQGEGAGHPHHVPGHPMRAAHPCSSVSWVWEGTESQHALLSSIYNDQNQRGCKEHPGFPAQPHIFYNPPLVFDLESSHLSETSWMWALVTPCSGAWRALCSCTLWSD